MIVMKLDLFLFRISLLCIISGPIFFIIGMNMDLFYGVEVAWAATLTWWGFGVGSFIIGVILLIISSMFKPRPIRAYKRQTSNDDEECSE